MNLTLDVISNRLGFFVDINLFTGNNGRTAELPKVDEVLQKSINSTLGSNSLAETGLADEDSNLMLKLNFLAFKVFFCHCFQHSFSCSLVTL